MKTPAEGRVKKTPEGQAMKTPVESWVKRFVLPSRKTSHDINPVIV